MLFAYGKDISDVIKDLPSPVISETGLVLAWDKEAGNTIYQKGSNVDIFKTPEDAVAYWDKKGNQHGIYYENSNNTGFIPIDGVTLEEVGIGEIANYELRIYPNPTTGQLTIDNGQLTMNNVELFDIYGKKQLSIINCPLSIEINISHLPRGVYFVKIETEKGGKIEKIIKK